MERGRSRQHEELQAFAIDLPFLIKERKVLTKKEFQKVVCREPFHVYKNIFFKRKIQEMYNNFKDQEWFRERYQSENKNVEVYAERLKGILENPAYDLSSKITDYYTKNIFISNIPAGYPLEDLRSLASKCLYFKEFSTYTNGFNNSFAMTGVISIDGNTSEAIEFMRSITSSHLNFKYSIVEFNTVNISESNLTRNNDVKAASEIFKYLCKIHKIIEEENDGTFMKLIEQKANESDSPLNYYIMLLRKVFLFCYHCHREFDSVYAMKFFCGDHHVFSDKKQENTVDNLIFSRRYEVLKEYSDLSSFKKASIDPDLNEAVQLFGEENFKCNICGKPFKTAEYVKTHIKNKHQEFFEDIVEKFRLFNLFISNIDFLMFSALSGTDDKYIPGFLENLEKASGVKYYDEVFSGEIKLERMMVE